ncbi:hypothetical protein F5Y16DRAFT_63384 [Xylariaceae sp. FL0255]|nr:hypothetical protein F5Y16DRAFT_63384 [Xylariaceae sp. FL0255]
MSALDAFFSRFPSLRSPRIAYHRVPENDRRHHDADLDMSATTSGPGRGSGTMASRRRLTSALRTSPRRLFIMVFLVLLLGATIIGGTLRMRRYYEEKRIKEKQKEEEEKKANERIPYHWEAYPHFRGFFNGVKTLVNYSDWIPEQQLPRGAKIEVHDDIPLEPVVVNPYPDYSSDKYLEKHHPVQTCYMDEAENHATPDIYAYPGVPAGMPAPAWGAYEVLGIAADRCFERFGRFGPYGYSYNVTDGGQGLSTDSTRLGAEKVEKMIEKIDYRQMNWGAAQRKCLEKNIQRFELQDEGGQKPEEKKKLKRTAFVLRTWTGYNYDEIQLLTIRAMINELSLKSGGEYDVHLLVQVKDDTIPIWTSDEIYQQTIEENVPEEFWDITTLWSDQLMRLYYPGPWPPEDVVENHSNDNIYTVYRSAHFSLQWWAQEHREYDYVWNWEMDIRYTGHYYELLDRVSNWATKQPRKYMWERNAKFWIPQQHGPWPNFTTFVEEETVKLQDEEKAGAPIWGSLKFPTGKYEALPSPDDPKPPTTIQNDDYEWGVGEPADLITWNPLFDPSKTNWVFRNDVSGYDTSIDTPPRRSAIVTVARLSRRLLDTMHKETWRMRHSMFPEMFPPSMALHHGYKALYAPHPVFFDRNWPLDIMDRTFNYPETPEASPFGWGENNMLGGTFYYNAGFSGALWRRWLGSTNEEEYDPYQNERGDTDRLCLRPLLHHPIKDERVN